MAIETIVHERILFIDETPSSPLKGQRTHGSRDGHPLCQGSWVKTLEKWDQQPRRKNKVVCLQTTQANAVKTYYGFARPSIAETLRRAVFER